MSSWVDQMFAAGQTTGGGVVRRSLDDIYRLGVRDEIVQRAQSNGWHVVETGDQLVVLCHPGDLRIVC